MRMSLAEAARIIDWKHKTPQTKEEVLSQLAVWKVKTVAARRSGDVEREKELNAAKGRLMVRLRNTPGKCLDCNITIEPGAVRCMMHARGERFGKFLLNPDMDPGYEYRKKQYAAA